MPKTICLSPKTINALKPNVGIGIKEVTSFKDEHFLD